MGDVTGCDPRDVTGPGRPRGPLLCRVWKVRDRDMYVWGRGRDRLGVVAKTQGDVTEMHGVVTAGTWPTAVPSPEHAAHLAALWAGWGRHGGGGGGDVPRLLAAEAHDMFQFGVRPPPPPPPSKRVDSDGDGNVCTCIGPPRLG